MQDCNTSPEQIPDGYKRCKKCGEVKPIDLFVTSKESKDGKRNSCIQCKREYERQQRINNLDRYREYDKKKDERRKERDPDQYKERLRKSSRTYEKRHRNERIARDRVANNTPEQIARRRKGRKTPHGRLLARARVHRYRARKVNAEGNYTNEEIQLIIRTQRGKCWWCGKSVGDKYHIDHRFPLSRGGSNDASNLVLSCVSCNTSKGGKLPQEWNGRLL